MIDYLTRLLVTTEGLIVGSLFLAAFVMLAWRNRRRRFLFYGWFGALFIFALAYVLIFVGIPH